MGDEKLIGDEIMLLSDGLRLGVLANRGREAHHRGRDDDHRSD